MGVHTGPVVVGAIDSEERLADIAQAFTSYLANGLQQLAREDAIYVSETIQRQAEGFFQFKDLAPCALPEIAQAVHVYACGGVNPVRTRLEAFLRRHRSAFLGREREIDLLTALWTKARSGQGQVVCRFGVAGVGKSRLAYEFQCALAQACTLQAQALSYGQAVPYHAFIPLLRVLLPAHGDDAAPNQRQQIRTRLQVLHPMMPRMSCCCRTCLASPWTRRPSPAYPPRSGNGSYSRNVSG